MSQFPNVVLIEIELAIGDQPFQVTEEDNKYHLRYRTDQIFWYKENLNNIAFRWIRDNIKSNRPIKVAWIDADTSFTNTTWVKDTLALLDQFKFVQLFETFDSLGPENEILTSDPGFIKQWLQPKDGYAKLGRSGAAWASTVETLEQLNYLPDWDILGASDWATALALTGKSLINKSRVRKQNIAWAKQAEYLINGSVSYVPGTIVHHFHGWPADRGYSSREQILHDHEFEFETDMIYRQDGLLQFSPTLSKPGLISDITGYFASRKEHEKTDDILYVVTSVFSPSQYKSRYNTYTRFAAYMATFKNVKFYTVELAIGDQEHHITDANNPYHLQLRADKPLWYKENILNILIKSLPPEARYVAVVDCDLIWEGDDWAALTIQALQSHPVVQMFSTWQSLDEHDVPAEAPVRGFVQRYRDGTSAKGMRGQPGLAWAWRRETLEAMGGLIDIGVLGSGDSYMAYGLIGMNRTQSEVLDIKKEPDIMTYVQHLDEALDPWIARAEQVIGRNVGYVDLNVLHCFHGEIKNRGYDHRWRILDKHNYRAVTQLKYNTAGIIKLEGMPDEFYVDVLNYFDSRNEDQRIKEQIVETV